MALTDNQTTSALQLLADAALDREHELQNYRSQPNRPDSDDENDSKSPLFDNFHNNGGSATVLQMTNFDAKQFHSIWGQFRGHITENWNTSRGRNSQYKAKYVLFITMVPWLY